MADESFPVHTIVQTERHLIAAAVALGAQDVTGWSSGESALIRNLPTVPSDVIQWLRSKILKGDDPLGEIFCYLRPSDVRREKGATYTPQRIVDAMLDWGEDHGKPARIIDPGVGSGRFLIAAAKRFPKADGVGIDIDPVAAIISRANISVNRKTLLK